MKKRTLVCFLIFILCVFHSTIISDTVFGQDADPTSEELAQMVYDDFNETLLRADLQDLTVQVLAKLSDPETLIDAKPLIDLLYEGDFGKALDAILSNPALITAVVPGATPEVIGLLTDDEGIRTVLMDSNVRTLMQDTVAVLELLRLLFADETWKSSLTPTNSETIQTVLGVDPGPDPDPEPPTVSIRTSSPTAAQSGSFDVAFATADVNGDAVTVTGSISVDPASAAGYYSIPSGTLTGGSVTITQTAPTAAMPTIAGATVTLTLIANDGTADSTPATVVIRFATAEFPTEPPDPPDKPEPPTDGELPSVDLVTSNLNGESRLGGLSLNRIHGRAFIRDLIAAAGLDSAAADALVEPAVEFLIAQIPAGIIPEETIRQNLTSRQAFSIFADEPPGLDFENFGNGITPTLSEALYDDTPNTSKFSTRDNLNLYVRVPSTLEGGSVQIRLNGVEAEQGQRIAPDLFQSDTIPYTFRLEETLAAANLPAWPALGNQLFSEVVLRYSQEGLEEQYIALQMNPVTTDKGVVWEGDVGIIPGRNVNYYFEVTLVEPVKLVIVNREALAEALLSPSGDATTVADANREYTINSWSMPDPRNLQIADRGILDAMFTDDVVAEIVRIALPLLSAGNTDLTIPGQELRKLQNLLLRNANELTNNFESNYDPMLASVFTVPLIDYEIESLWYANIDSMDDGAYTLEAVVYNADEEAVDHIAVGFETDTSAPEAELTIGTANADTTGYLNNNGAYVATAPVEGTSSLLTIKGTTDPGEIGVDEGFLLYQIIDLNENGEPVGTWLPLTIEASILSSDIWDLINERFPSSLDDSFKVSVPGSDIEIDIRDFALRSLLGLLETGVPGVIEAQDLQALVVDQLRGFLGIELTNNQYTLLTDLLGAVVDDIDLIPFTFEPERIYKFPIQGDQLPLLIGDYGVRAMGIDPLLNIGSHVKPQHIRIVPYQYDRSSVTMAALGDINHNGKDDAYEFGVIYDNARDVTLTVTIDERTVHPLNRDPQHPNASITVYYSDLEADGVWQSIDEVELVEGEGAAGDTRTILWEVGNALEDLLQAGDTVFVRTVTTNALQHPIDINGVDFDALTEDQDLRISDAFTINLDADVHPVDPVVLVVDVDTDSVVMKNQDSGAPQGTIMLEGYTPRRTVPATESIRIEVMRPGDDTPIKIGEVAVDDSAGMDGGVTEAIMFKGKTLAEVYVDDTLHIDSTSSYLKWIITVDTTLLDDTITVDSPAARDASLDENRYMVRAYAVGADGTDISPILMGEDYTEQFSVDNDDDVAPLGPIGVVVTSIEPADAMLIDNGDGTYTVSALVDKYDPTVKSPVVTLTLTPTADRHTYKDGGVKLLTTLPEGAIIGEVTETAEGSGVFTVTIDVGTLADDDEEVYNDKYLQNHSKDPYDLMYNPTEDDVYSFTVHALAYDNAEPYDDDTASDEVFLEYGNIQADDYEGDEITINVENTYRPDPGVIAVTVDNSDGAVNPDSGAPQGELTFNVYTYYITSAPTDGIRVEVARPVDDTWERITGTAVDPVEVDVSELPGIDDLDDITGGLIGITQAGTEADGESVVAIPGRYMKWQFIVDTRELALEDTFTADDEPINRLEDTISRGDDSQRDVSLDTNKYVVRAISLTPQNKAHTEYMQRDGVEASFSLDNVDDVPPLGPTNITDVADHVGSLAANEDGSFTARGIVDDAVESTELTFTIEPTAEPITYEGGKIGLVQTAPDGSVSHVEGSLDDGQITVDIGLLENGAYTYYALVADREVDDEGNHINWQDHENEVASPIITVHVLNFRVSDIMELMVTEVDDVLVEGELPDPIPLRDSIAVSFNVNNGTLFEDDLIGVVVGGQFRDGDDYTAGSDGEYAFMLSANNLMELPSQHTTPHGRVEIRERFVDFALANINLDNTAPVITFVTPTEGVTINDLPTLHAEYNDGDLGVGISADNTAVVSLDRLRPEEVVQDAVPIAVDPEMVEQDIDSVVYTRIDKLAGGAYQFTVMVTDSLGNVGEASVNFAVEGIDPTVVVTAPASGQEFDANPGSVTGFFAGGGDVGITKFTVNDVDVSESISVDGSNFTYTPEEGFGEDTHTVAVEVTDGSGLTAQTSLTFIVEHPVPTATIATPTAGQEYNHGVPIITGTFSGADPVSGTLSIDGEAVMDVSGNEFTYKPTEPLSDGDHTVMLMVIDVNGNTAEATTEFTVNIPGPSVAIHSPAGGQLYDHGTPEIAWKATGVAEPVSVTLTINGDAVELVDDADSYTPDSVLADGDYTAVVTATDANEKKAEATVVFSVFHPEPTVSIQSPTAGGSYDHEFSHIAGEFSGVGEVTIDLMLDGEAVEETKDGNQFTAELSDKLSEGEHMVTVMVTSENGKTAQASASFSVTYPEASVSISSPVAGDTYDHTFRHISGSFNGVAPVSVMLTVDDGDAIALEPDGNEFTHTLSDKLGEGSHTVSVTVMDANGETADASTTFSVVYPDASVSISSPTEGGTNDHTFRHISGSFNGVAPVSVMLTVDDGDAIALEPDGNEFTHTLSDKLGEGSHTVSVTVMDANGETADASTTFSVVYPEASVSISSPEAGDTYDHTYRHISGEFTGVGEVSVTLMVDGEAVDVKPEGNEFSHDLADKLDEGSHTVSVSVMDENGETAEASTTFSVMYPDASVSISSPTEGGTNDHTFRHISGSFIGVAPVSVMLTVDSGDAIALEPDGNEFTHTLSDKLGEGSHKVSVSVMDANGETAQASTTFSVVYPEASVSISSPEAGDTYDHTYRHISGSFIGVAPVSVMLTVDDGDAIALEPDGNEFTHTLSDKLGEGSHTVSVSVMDVNGETAQASTTFSVVYPEASVSISSPVAGDTYDHTFRHISGEFTGVGEVSVTLMVDGEAVDPDDVKTEGNEFSHNLADKLDEGSHTVSVSVMDENGETADASTTFSVMYPDASVSISSPVEGGTNDHTFRHISGSFIGVAPVSVMLTVDDGDAIALEPDGNEFTHTLSDKLDEGNHTVSVSVMDANGETAQASTTFSVVYPEASVSISSPVAGDTYDHMYRHISGEFTGVGEVSVTLMVDGEAVDPDDVKTEGNEFSHDLADKLGEGSHKVSVSVMDANGETAEASTTFTVMYPDASVSISSPTEGGTNDHTFRHISGSFNGVAPVSVMLTVDGGDAIALEPDGNEFTHNLSDKLDEGSHTVSVSVMDANGETADATTTFSVVYPDASVSISSPEAGDTYDHTYRHISGSFIGVAPVSVMLTVDSGDVIVLEPDGNEFTYNLSDKLGEGSHTVSVSVMDANGETADASTTFSIVYPEATVTIQSPVAGTSYDNGSIIVNGEYTGVGDVAVVLTVGGENVDVSKHDGNQFTGEIELLHGQYRATAKVTDSNGESATTSVDFIVDIPGPSVAILSPAAGQTYYQGKPIFRGHFTGMTEVELTTFTINGEDAPVEVEENQFTYTPSDDLATGEYIVMVEVTDENEKTAQATVVFNVMLDTTPPVISEVGPSGIVKDSWVNISAVITDEQSDILSVEFYIRDENDVNKGFVPFVSSVDPGPANHRITADKIKNGQIEISDSFEPGTHTMQVIAESLGGTTVHTWSFTVVIDTTAPIISSITPSGTIHRGLPTVSASANDESGVAEIIITVMDDNGEEVTGGTMDDAEADVTGITRADFMPENPLDEGSYTIEVRATDTNGNSSSAKGVFTVDFDTAAPIITSSAPQDGARLTYKQTFNKQTGNDDKENARPTISLTYGDAETGVNVGSIKLVIEAPKKGGGTLVAPIDLTDDQKSATQVLYTLSSPVFPDEYLEPGEYVVKLEVSDNAHQQGNVPEDNDGARKANTAVYQFSFFVEYSDAPILAVKPYNHPNPFKDSTRISFTLNRTSTVSIVIYDVTLRPVRVLKDNEVMSAGNYIGRHGTQWDGKTSSGENLARGIYFCEIVVTDGIEPEYAILKLALTR